MVLEFTCPHDALKFSNVHREKEWAYEALGTPRVIEIEDDASSP